MYFKSLSNIDCNVNVKIVSHLLFILYMPFQINLYFKSYEDINYLTRVNYYSSASSLVRYNNFATGNANNDNQAQLILKRFLMSNIGNEAMTCSITPISKNF
jgi:hypothetical protein